MKEISGFFNEAKSGKPKQSPMDLWFTIAYIFLEEFGWTEQDLEQASVPFIVGILDKRSEIAKKRDKEMKKKV